MVQFHARQSPSSVEVVLPPDPLATRSVADSEECGAFEADQFHRMSAWAGHAGPDSTYPYINQFEPAIEALTRRARQAAWAEAPSAQALKFFADLAADPVDPLRVDTDVGRGHLLVASTADVGLKTRLQLTFHIANLKRDAVAAAASYLDVKMADAVLLEVHEAMELARLVRRRERTPAAAISAVRSLGSWVVSAKAVKFVDLLEAMARRIESGDVTALRSLFEGWRQVRVGEHLSMDDGYTGAAFLRQLQNLGLSRKSMVIKSREGAPQLDRSIAAFQLPVVELGPREEKVQHRLQLIEPDVGPEDASGKQVSAVGFHWLMVLVTSWLCSAGELSWS
jgi:hypothetical protein